MDATALHLWLYAICAGVAVSAPGIAVALCIGCVVAGIAVAAVGIGAQMVRNVSSVESYR